MNFIPMRDRLNNWSEWEPNSGCRLWFGAVDRKGYGRLCVGRTTVRAHRAAWLEERGGIPSGLFVLHRCDTPACINTDHLYLGSHAQNMIDCTSRNRQAHGEKHGACKLSDAEALEALCLREQGVPVRQIAERFSVSGTHIYMLIRGMARKHLRRAA